MPSSMIESVPSLGEVSQSSSEGSHDEAAMPKLVKAPTLIHTKQWEALITDNASPFKPSGPEPPRSYAGFHTETQTLRPRSTLSWKSAVSHDSEATKISESSSFASPMSPPQRTSVKNLVNKFSLFGGFQQAPQKKKSSPPSVVAPSEVSETSTLDSRAESNWQRKAASLERECSALQGIICADSVNMTKMKREASELQKSNDRYISEIVQLSSMLKSTAEKLVSLEVTQQDQDEIENARSETIRLLKEEIERINGDRERKEIGYLNQIRMLNEEIERTKEEGEDRDFARVETIRALREEIERLTETQTENCETEIEFEHELFARQILRDEQALKDANENLEKKDNVIAKLAQQVEDDHAGRMAMGLLQDKYDALEQEMEQMKSEFERKLKMKDSELKELNQALDDIRRTNEEEKSLSSAQVTEVHLAETEQDLETALQLLKQQEEQMWHLEERIFQLTPQDLQTKKDSSGEKSCHFPSTWY